MLKTLGKEKKRYLYHPYTPDDTLIWKKKKKKKNKIKSKQQMMQIFDGSKKYLCFSS